MAYCLTGLLIPRLVGCISTRPAGTPAAPEVVERSECTVTIGGHEHEGKARVCDTGIGIPGKLLGNLLDKFNPTRRAGLQGETTTGLFIARQIVQLHGCDIWVESRERESTCFFIELPGSRTQPAD